MLQLTKQYEDSLQYSEMSLTNEEYLRNSFRKYILDLRKCLSFNLLLSVLKTN